MSLAMPLPRRLLAAACVALLSQPGVAGDAPTPPADLAEPPFWPIGIDLPASIYAAHPELKPATKAQVAAWVPPGAQRIRGMLAILNNSDSKEFGQHQTVRDVCAKQELAIVYLRYGMDAHINQGADTVTVDAVMGALAEKSGIREFRHAPWITFGKSASSKFPFHLAWAYPRRTIAGITYHGEVPSWPPAPWAKLGGESILWVCANGETEWGGTWFNHVRPGLLNWNAQKGWLAHQAVARDIGHGDYPDAAGSAGFGKPFPGKVTCVRVWDYLAAFIDTAVEARVPKGAYAGDGPVELKQVDPASGYAIDPFAVETMFGVPRLPLEERPEGYVLAGGGGDEAPVSGYRALAPPAGFAVADGVPVVPLAPGRSPTEWLITDSLKFAMQADPMLELGDLQRLTPKPGDGTTIDGKPLTFQPIAAKHVWKDGGIYLKNGLRPTNGKITLLAYTVIEVPERRHVKVAAGFTAATRIQLVLGGVPVRHKEVLDLQPGRYPLLVVLRMTANWERIEPHLADVAEAEIAQAKRLQAEADQRAAEIARLKAAGPQAPPVLFRKVADLPAAERKKMLWLADRRLAQAWVELHNVNGMQIEVP